MAIQHISPNDVRTVKDWRTNCLSMRIGWKKKSYIEILNVVNFWSTFSLRKRRGQGNIQKYLKKTGVRTTACRSLQWPRGLRRRSSVARLLRLWVRIPPGAWMFVCVVLCQVEVSATD
jgi:hypothetical protein